MIWVENFNRFNRATWTKSIVKSDPSEAQTYVPNAVYVSGGNLVIKVSKISNGYISGSINSDFKRYIGPYGTLTIRARMPKGGKGIWPALWLMGKNEHQVGWPQCGEIDLVEYFGGYQGNSNLAVSSLHYGKTVDFPTNCWQNVPNPSTYHNYQMAWTHDCISFSIDNIKYGTKDISDIPCFHQPFYLLINVAVGNSWIGYPDNTVQFPQYMYIDYIKYISTI